MRKDLQHAGPPAAPGAGGEERSAARDHRGGRRGEALATLVVNKLRGTLSVLAVKAPGFGDRRKAMLEISPSSREASASPKTSASSWRTSRSRISASQRRSRLTRTYDDPSRAVASRSDIEGRSSRSGLRSRRPPPTTTARSCRRGSPSWSAGRHHQGRCGHGTEMRRRRLASRTHAATKAAVERGSSPRRYRPGVAPSRHGETQGEERGHPDRNQHRAARPRGAGSADRHNAGYEGSIIRAAGQGEGQGVSGCSTPTAASGDMFEAGIIDPTR